MQIMIKNCKKSFITLSIILLTISKSFGQNCDQFIRLANGNLNSSANGVAWMIDFGKIGFDRTEDIYIDSRKNQPYFKS